MGLRLSTLSILPLLAATPALAQQNDAADPLFTLPRAPAGQPANPRQQGPELDVFRAPATTAPAVPPPVAAPTITPAPTPRATPRPAPPPPAARPVDRAPIVESTSPPASAPKSAETPAAPLAPAPVVPAPRPPVASPTPAPEPSVPPATPDGTSPWPWIAGGAVILVALLGLFRHRRRPSAGQDDVVASIVPPAPDPTQPRPTPPPAPIAERARIDIALDVEGARYSMMGATIAYGLTLHNIGTLPAEDILVRALITNADEGRKALLEQFFGGTAGAPMHSVVTIAPGESHRLTGDIRLPPDAIVAVQAGHRALLIPLLAFDVQYRWGEGRSGRSARAFIAGQEQDPPTDRLAPFRIDMGPRQYRGVASRATALSLDS